MTKKRKSNQPVTFELLTEFYADFLKPQFNKLNKQMDAGFKELKKAVTKNSEDTQELKVETMYLKDEVRGLKAEFSDTVSRKEFNQLKGKVETLQA